LVVVDGSSESASYSWCVVAHVEGFTDIEVGRHSGIMKKMKLAIIAPKVPKNGSL